MNQQQVKRAIKICCDGEIKRLKISGDYAELINRTRESFNKQGMQDSEFKFFYLDEEQEVISITSQADLTEAFNIEDLASLKLTVAENMQIATKLLYEAIMENKSLAGSVNQSQSQLGAGGMRSSRSRANSEFDQITNKLQRSPFDGSNQQIFNPSSAQQHRLQVNSQFQRQVPHDCNSSHKSSHQDGHERPSEDKLRNSGVMVVGMGMNAKDIQKAADIDGKSDNFGQPRILTCVVCKGTKKIGSKQKKCKTCKGTGLLPINKFEGLLDMVRGELAVYMERSMRDVMHKYVGAQVAPAPSMPIAVDSVEESKQVMREAEVRNVPIPVPQIELTLEALLVKDSMPETKKMRPGQAFTKSWSFKNNGQLSWPKGVSLMMVAGDDFQFDMEEMHEIEVLPGENENFKATFKAPDVAGKYVTYFRLGAQQNYFGPKVFCSIEVENQPEEQQPAIVEENKVPAQHVQNLEVNSQLSESTIAKNKYTAQASQHAQYSDLLMLFEFGFTDFVVNEYLLEKYNSVDGVADMLMNGQVSDECIKEISAKKQALAEGK